MRNFIGFVAVGALTLIPAFAANAQLPPLVDHVSTHSGASAFPDLLPGDNIEIACEAVEKRAADLGCPGRTYNLGYARRIRTRLSKGLGDGRTVAQGCGACGIPEMPTLQDHTVGVDVYVVGTTSAEHCDAGQVKIS